MLPALCLLWTLGLGITGKAVGLLKPEEPCTLQVELGLNEPEDEAVKEDLEGAVIRVELYRVGEVDAYGRYKSLAGFESLDLESVGSQTTAEEWEEKAGKAAMLVKEAEKGEALLSPEHYVLEVKEGKGVLRELPSGMYLMAPREAVTLEYCYAFLPSLLALPGYGLSAEPEGQGGNGVGL